MTKFVRLMMTTAVVLGFAQAASAQTADEIIEKHLAAIGGRAVLTKVTSRSATGTITIATPAGEFTGPIEVLNQAPNKVRTLIKLDLSAVGVGQMTVDQRFDGMAGYVMDTLQGNRDMTGDQLESMRHSVFPSPFLNYKASGFKVELVGKEKVGEGEAYVLIMTPTTGPAVRQYVDAQTFLPVRQVVKLNVPPVGDFEQTTDFSDHREIDGVKLPFQLKSSSSVQTFTVTITKVEHNGPLDPALFSKPAN